MTLKPLLWFFPVSFVACSAPAPQDPVSSTPRLLTDVHRAPPIALAAAAGGHVTALDEAGRPSFVWSTRTETPRRGETPVDAARRYLCLLYTSDAADE